MISTIIISIDMLWTEQKGDYHRRRFHLYIASPGAFSAITDTDATTATTTTVTTAATKKKRKRKSRRTVPQRTNDECEALKAKNREDESYFQAVEE